MRKLTRAMVALPCVLFGVGACITEVREKRGHLAIPGTLDRSGPEETTEAKQAKCREWIAELAMEGAPLASQPHRTLHLVKQLVEHLPFSTTSMQLGRAHV